MRKKLLISGAVVLLIAVGLTGCIDEKSKFIGTWQTEDRDTTLEFDEDNTVAISGDGPLGIVELTGNFEYSVGDNTVTFSAGSFGVTLNYNFPESNELVLSNDQGNSVTFIKQ
mgnify:CR=1 FL=1